MAYSSISKPSLHFNTLTYSGNGASSQALTGLGFQPDFVWLKDRTEASNHQLQDSGRGKSDSNYYYLHSDSNAAQGVQSDADGVNTFGTDGFTVGYYNSTAWNKSGNDYASWNWKANPSTSSNSDGTINSTISLNSTAGISMVYYTGTGSAASVGHGLGVKPDLVIAKIYSTTGDWNVYHDSFAAQERIKLNSQGAKNTNTSIFASLPTASVVNIGTGGDINTNGASHIMYCFARKQGYSAFGTYRGNASEDGPFIYTGFKPAFIMIKITSGTNNWEIHDNKRVNTFNVVNAILQPDVADAESGEANGNNRKIDIYSNGFKLKQTGTQNNTNGGSYLYWAIAEEPLVANVGPDGVPATAR